MQSDHQSPSPPPLAILYDLRSILERLDLGSLFGREQPLEVELGCGDGSFLMEYARLHPERNFIGIERLLGRIRKLERKGRRMALSNLRGVRIESSYFLRHLLPEHSASAIHVYFPDPWPKRKHARHRLINEAFPGIARQALIPAGTVYLRTDNPSYFEQMNEAFSAAPFFSPAEAPPELSSVLTDFEKEFVARGIKTLTAAYRLRG